MVFFLPHEHERCCYYLRLKYWKNSYPFPTIVLQLSLFSFSWLSQSPGLAPGRPASLMKRPGVPLPFSSTEDAEAAQIRHVAAGLYPQPLVWKPQTSTLAGLLKGHIPFLLPSDLWICLQSGHRENLFCPHLALGCHCKQPGTGRESLPPTALPSHSLLSLLLLSPPGSSSWSLWTLPLAPEFQRDLNSLSSFLFDAQLLGSLFLHLPVAKS